MATSFSLPSSLFKSPYAHLPKSRKTHRKKRARSYVNCCPQPVCNPFYNYGCRSYRTKRPKKKNKKKRKSKRKYKVYF